MSTTLLASGLADKKGEQDNQLESLVCHCVKLGGCKLCGLRSQHLWQSLIGMLREGIPEQVRGMRRRMLGLLRVKQMKSCMLSDP